MIALLNWNNIRTVTSVPPDERTKFYSIIWATSRENVSTGIFDQVRFKPACSATETS